VALNHLASYAGRRVLVTGGAGFIGRHVADAVAQVGAEVVVTRRETGDAMRSPGRRVVVADLSEAGAAAQLIRHVRPSVTFNLAGYGVDPAERDETRAERINHELVAELADACGACGDPAWRGLQLVHAGSALEYGTAGGNLREESRAAPSTLYGRSKLAGTAALQDACSRGRVRGITARLFTVYGPGEHPGRLLPSLIEAKRRGTPIPLTAGTQRRDFTYVADVVDAMLRLGALDNVQHDIVNVATGALTSVREFVVRAADVIGLDRAMLRFGAVATRAEEMAHDNVSIARLVEMCGWKPETTIEEGVRAAVEAARTVDA
jgi:nucleoside-diphosphate-sugar epimerase